MEEQQDSKRYKRFQDFYPYYLSQHQNPVCRFLHVIGSCCSIVFLFVAIIFFSWIWLVAAIVVGYVFAWIGHFIFEKNKPATFKQPLFSLLADFVMLDDVLTGKLKVKK